MGVIEDCNIVVIGSSLVAVVTKINAMPATMETITLVLLRVARKNSVGDGVLAGIVVRVLEGKEGHHS